MTDEPHEWILLVRLNEEEITEAKRLQCKQGLVPNKYVANSIFREKKFLISMYGLH
jgi:hypothetical protein